ncbi:MAG: SMC-Scp complex subunit ScpB [Ruaniaceae bacterium]|nr:SMC-Scp complex subunit ScpB [Ruaniaceae bacterium]
MTEAFEARPDDALPEEQRGALEAILMVADSPVPAEALAEALGLPTGQALELLRGLVDEYEATARGFILAERGGGWRIYSHPRYADVVGQFILAGQTARLTAAALETLAVVAYKQPISRGAVSAIRGVNVDSVMRTLTTRGLVDEAGTDPATGAILYATTPYFLERIGLATLDELPPLAPYLPELDALGEEDLR